MKSLPYYSIYILVTVLFTSYYFGGFSTLLIPFLAFFLVPILEIMLGDDDFIPEELADKNKIEFSIPLWLWVPTQIGYLIIFAKGIHEFNILEILFFSISVGILNGGIGINVAHELIHKSNQIEKTLGKILLSSVCYGHFYIEHIWGHHRNIGRNIDSATARMNETIYEFIPRSIIGSYHNAFLIGSKKKTNPVLINNYISAIYVILVLYIFGLYASLFIIIQSIIAILMLESANYIEHYGLERKENEIVSIMHSWNTNKKITNYLTFRLQIHSDHHVNSSKKYQTLNNYQEAPTLPTGYTGSIILAYLPPIWFSCMNPKLVNFQKRYQ